MSLIFWFQVGFGLLFILILIGFGIKSSKDKPKSLGDEKILEIVNNKLDEDEFNHFELESIVSLNIPNITSVIAKTDYIEIAIEVDNYSGKIISKEKVER